MKINLYNIAKFSILLLTACVDSIGNEISKQDYAVSYKDSSQKASAECLLDYILSEQLIQKKAQIIAKNDTILVRLFGKPKGNWKKNEERKTAEFATKLLANDFSKICFQKKIVRLQIGQDFSKKENYLEATSDGSVGFRDYKP
jgi:hypothetical protein